MMSIRDLAVQSQHRPINAGAVIESLAISVGYFGFWAAMDVAYPLLVSCIVSPLLLLRSPASVKFGAVLFHGLESRLHSSTVPSKYRKMFILLALIFGSFAIKAYTTARYIHHGLRKLPNNFVYANCQMRLYDPVSLVPETVTAGEVIVNLLHLQKPESLIKSGMYSFLGAVVALIIFSILFFGLLYLTDGDIINWPEEFLRHELGLDQDYVYIFLIIVFSIVFIIIFSFCGMYSMLVFFTLIIAWFYRISIKGAFIIWMPMIYVARYSPSSGVKLEVILNEMNVKQIWRLRRWLASINILLFFLSVAAVTRFNALQSKHVPPELIVMVRHYFTPNTVHLWEVAAFLNGILAWAVYLFVVNIASERISAGLWTERMVNRLLHGYRIFRLPLTYYTVLVLILKTANVVVTLNFPNIDPAIFPRLHTQTDSKNSGTSY